MKKDEIIIAAMSLSPRERNEVAETLWQSLAPDEFTPEQLAEIHRRIAAIDAGQTELLQGDEVMGELRHRYKQ